MPVVLNLLSLVLGVGSLICFIMVIIKMFQNDATGVAIVSLLLLLCGIGALVAFVYGWVKAAEWGITNVMLAWTGCFVGGIVLTVLQLAMGGGAIEPI
jgi:hypothetical protein